MIKILIYTENYKIGGGNRYLTDLVNAIDKNYIVYLLSNKNGIFKSDFNKINRIFHYTSLNIKTIGYYKNRLRDYSIIYKIIFHGLLKLFEPLFLIYFKIKNQKIFTSYLKNINPNLIFSCNGGFPAALSCLDLVITAKKLEIPSYLSIVSTPSKSTYYERFLYSKIFDDSSNFIVNSKTIKSKIIESRNIKSSQIHVLTNPIDSAYFNYSKLIKSDNKLKIGYVSRIEDSKGIYDLIHSFSELIKLNSQVELLVVGNGDKSKLQRTCKKYNILDSVSIIGYFPGDIMDFYNSIDILVFPSHWEGLPYTILEAMIMKKIIISTNVGGIPEVIENNYSGKLISPKNTKELLSVLVDVVNNYENYKYMGDNAYEFIIKHHSFDLFKNKLRDLIKINKLN